MLTLERISITINIWKGDENKVKKALANHRCIGSLKKGVSINKISESYNLNKEERWALIHYEIDFEYDCLNAEYIENIFYCPYCGEELK